MFSFERTPAVVKRMVKPLMQPQPPKSVASAFREVSRHGLDEIETALRSEYFTANDAWYADPAYLSSPEGKRDLADHVSGRLHAFRKTVIPWLADARPLDGCSVLEIGCGTGSSTVALAEQGAMVTAVDVVESSLAVAKMRCRVHGVDAEFLCANATEVHQLVGDRAFDFLIFFATLEHMTHEERMSAMKSTWDMLPPGSFWCVIETPNRLWYYDQHTSLLPFYMWLPDDLAFAYSRLSSRRPFRDLYREWNGQAPLDFLRRGRGVSYHEFELTIGSVTELDVVSSLPQFLRKRSSARRLIWMLSDKKKFQAFLRKAGPRIHSGFYEESLDLIIRRP